MVIELTDEIRPGLPEIAQSLANDFMNGARDDIVNALARLPSIEAAYMSAKILQCLDGWFDKGVFIGMLEENTLNPFDIFNETTLVNYEK